jgi:hypothetical protein
MSKKTAGNTRLAQWGLKWFIETLYFYCKFVLADNLVFQNPPLRQAWERYAAYCNALTAKAFRHCASLTIKRTLTAKLWS